ncbi:hypothetical protein Daura_38305 [Dactylosporangium aurantiacum]|uniref:Arginase n=1 Tax=Dactylosporangium aurantiacum TaxID=35754 RepID=A0A9Q9IEA5_9ACTN|nr:hypothetical protein [Dactylosporangium aurantiacum]MDG6101726.1 hypothetical protein [Dactylosporangium aurantiacum]UWZ52462.1 hypothetical protein Daura_38305 [Dactylosporangium aurantiacum]
MRIDPIFFNAGRWGLDYTPEQGQWSDKHVKPMIEKIGAVLPGGQNPHPVMYIDAASNDAANLPPDIRRAWLHGERLFDKPVGSRNADNQHNGATRAVPFCGALGAWLATVPQTNPFFAIIDSNECHHLSVPLAAWAFSATPAGRAKIVVNFDAHNDIRSNTVVTDPLRCDNWGMYVLRQVGEVYPAPVADVYVGIGNKQLTGADTWQDSFAFLAGRPSTKVKLGAGDMAAQLDKVIELLGDEGRKTWTGYDLYLTVDRDVESSSFTDYGDGSYPPDEVWATVKAFIEAAARRRVRCAGFDICGLPTVAGSSRVSTSWRSAERIDRAIQDITAYLAPIVDLSELRPSLLASSR